MSNVYIALDLELEQPKTRADTQDSFLDTEKIIQVGFIIYQIKPFKVIEKHCYHVNIGVPLSKIIKKLTNIKDEDIASGISLKEVYNILYTKTLEYNAIRSIVQWGGGDIEQLKLELGNSVEWKFGRSGLNIKHTFQMWARANNIRPNGGLKKSMNKLKLTFEGSCHNAMWDAYNTAKVHAKLENLLVESTQEV